MSAYAEVRRVCPLCEMAEPFSPGLDSPRCGFIRRGKAYAAGVTTWLYDMSQVTAQPDNWNCDTLVELREALVSTSEIEAAAGSTGSHRNVVTVIRAGDTTLAIVHFCDFCEYGPPAFLAAEAQEQYLKLKDRLPENLWALQVQWYKNRGKTNCVLAMDDEGHVSNASYTEVEVALDYLWLLTSKPVMSERCKRWADGREVWRDTEWVKRVPRV